MSLGDSFEKMVEDTGFVQKGPMATPSFVEGMVTGHDFHRFPGTTKIVCLGTLYNGFTVEGSSACADPANFNEELGRKIAYKQALYRAQAFAGFLIRQMQWEASIRGDRDVADRFKQFIVAEGVK